MKEENLVERPQFDDLDRDIMSVLQVEGRMPFTEVAERLDISEATVRRRVQQLLDHGIMQIVAVVEPRFLGLGAAAMIGVRAEIGKVDDVAEAIAKLPDVSYLLLTCGEFDLFVEVFCEDREEFVHFLHHKLHETPGVRSTRTFMILNTHKVSYRWGEAFFPAGGARAE